MSDTKVLEFNEQGKIKRNFTKEWSESGIIRDDRIPNLIASLVSQKENMVLYIEALHNETDNLNQIINIKNDFIKDMKKALEVREKENNLLLEEQKNTRNFRDKKQKEVNQLQEKIASLQDEIKILKKK